MKKNFILLISTIALIKIAAAQSVDYGYETHSLSLRSENISYKMAYMDVPSTKANAETVLLLHGKNFNGFYWKSVIAFLHNAGYRVLVPDQVGWGKSDRPNLHYSFHLLAANTKALLDTLHIQRVKVIGHSMGGMLAVRFSLMYPQSVTQLLLENPIGLEDYKTFIPYQPLDSLYKKESQATYNSYLQYQKSYYPVWEPHYEPLVAAQAADLQRADFKEAAFVNAVSYQMIYEQPVVYELQRLTMPVLLVIGLADRTVVGKDRLKDSEKNKYGQYPALGRATQKKIRGSKLQELPGVGHIPHIQAPLQFEKAVLNFFK